MRKQQPFYKQQWFMIVAGLVVFVAAVAGISASGSNLQGNLRLNSAAPVGTNSNNMMRQIKQLPPAPNNTTSPTDDYCDTYGCDTPKTTDNYCGTYGCSSTSPYKLQPAPNGGTPAPGATKPGIWSPANNGVYTNFPRVATIAWGNSLKTDTYKVEVTCDYCSSVSTPWLNPTMYNVSGNTNTFTLPALPGDNQYRVRVQDVTTGLWSDYVYFTFRTNAKMVDACAQIKRYVQYNFPVPNPPFSDSQVAQCQKNFPDLWALNFQSCKQLKTGVLAVQSNLDPLVITCNNYYSAFMKGPDAQTCQLIKQYHANMTWTGQNSANYPQYADSMCATFWPEVWYGADGFYQAWYTQIGI